MRNILETIWFKIVTGVGVIIGLVAGIIQIVVTFEGQILIWSLIGIAFIIISVSLWLHFRKQKKEIKRLKDRMSDVEQTASIAVFKGWELVFSHLRYSNLKLKPRNEVDLELLEVTNQFTGTGVTRNAKVTFRFIGYFRNSSRIFKLIFGGDVYSEFEKLNLIATDNLQNVKLSAKIAPDIGRDSRVKDLIVSFKNEIKKGYPFDISVSYEWPNIANMKTDYFVLGNIYSYSTKKIRFILEQPYDVTFNTVEAYKYSIHNEEPKYISDIQIDANQKYIFESNNPEMNTEYILYYA